MAIKSNSHARCVSVEVKGIKKHMSQKKGKDKIAKTYVDKKTGKRKETNPWALAWAQYDKYGVPSRIEKD